MCGYDSDYLRSSGGSHGNKLLHWSAVAVERWMRGIELGEYVEGLGGHGIHGAVMVRRGGTRSMHSAATF